MPLKDVAAAGGWRDVSTLLTSYQQTDEETLRRVQLGAPKLMAEGVKSPEVPPIPTPVAGGAYGRGGGK
jgi:hypothetical protein